MANDVIAIDDVNIMDKPCETGFFTINDFTDLISSTQKGDYMYGPEMFTEDGYAFRILVSKPKQYLLQLTT